MPAAFLMDQERQLPLRELSVIVAQVKQPNEELIMVGFKKPSVVFYTQKQVNYYQIYQRSCSTIFKNRLPSQYKPTSLLILAEQKKLSQMDLQPDDYKNLATKGAYQLIRVSFKKMKSQKLNIS